MGTFQRRRARRYSSTAGLPFDDEELESRLVWIWATARSGSTWFLRLLSHPAKLVDGSQDPSDLLGFRVPEGRERAIDAIPVDTTFVSNHLVPLAGGADYDDSWAPKTFSAGLGLTDRPNYFFSSKYEDVWRPEVRRLMLVRFNRLIERTAERYPVADPLVLLKEVAGAHAAPLVMSLFPRSRMILLIRDGRDVVDSQTAANQPGGWLPVKGYETPEERLHFVRRRSRTWVGDTKALDRAFEAHPAELRRMVRYEDLLADTASTLRPLVDWLDRRRGPHWVEQVARRNSFDAVPEESKGATKFFRSATPGRWRENLTVEEQSVAHEVMGERLVELGYSLEGPRPEAAGVAPPPAAPAADDAGSAATEQMNRVLRAAAAGRDVTGINELVHKRGGAGSRRRGQVALTFDDGPVSRTSDILNALGRHQARATFFLVGRKIPGQEGVVRRIARERHEIGNHSFGHASYPTDDDVAANSALIRDVTGSAPTVFRPPFGAIDRPGALSAQRAGMSVILWTVDSEDVLPPWIGIEADEVYGNVIDEIRPGSIVLMHDGQPWSRAADALPAILDTLADRGYRCVTVSELLASRPPRTRKARLRRWIRSR